MPEQPKVIRKRIKSVSSTKKITRTMEMVATAKRRLDGANFAPEQRQLLGLVADGVVQRYS